jgi:mono/diheme cytochrome c family protein
MSQEAAPTHASGQKNSSKAAADKAMARAKEIYGVDCALCHGANGDGKTDLAKDMQLSLKDWTDPKSLADKSDADLFKMIRSGNDKMPPEPDGRAKDDEVKSLILYIRSMSKDQPAAAPAEPAAPTAPPASN